MVSVSVNGVMGAYTIARWVQGFDDGVMAAGTLQRVFLRPLKDGQALSSKLHTSMRKG
jgi:hypothetical protein